MKIYIFRAKILNVNDWVQGSLVQHYDGTCDILYYVPFICEEDTNMTDFKLMTIPVEPLTVHLIKN